jgi:hypothetical protein
MRRSIAMISEHASPLADFGRVDRGGQNVYVAHVAENLARLGYQVDVFTRRDDKPLSEIYEWMDGIRIIHVLSRNSDLIDLIEAFANRSVLVLGEAMRDSYLQEA